MSLARWSLLAMPLFVAACGVVSIIFPNAALNYSLSPVLGGEGWGEGTFREMRELG